jgi:hypothetical protein
VKKRKRRRKKKEKARKRYRTDCTALYRIVEDRRSTTYNNAANIVQLNRV